MTERENWLAAIELRPTEWIPCSFSFAPLTWKTHREGLEQVVLSHPRLFPRFRKGDVDFDKYGPAYRQGERFRDNWGCVWFNAIGGIEGQVVEHPLADWNALKSYRPPDPRTHLERGPHDWNATRKRIEEQRAAGRLTWGNGERLFDRLYFLRGYENLMLDIATDDPHLPLLVEMLLEHEKQLVKMWLDLGVDVIGFHTDIGTQRALMIHPDKFRRYIKPMFKELFGMCRRGGAHAYLSSDGNLLEIVDDLIECGCSAHDPQLRACTLEGIVATYKGKLCANVDLDRQMFAFCTPREIRQQVREVVERMRSPRGGLMLSVSVWDDNTPLANIAALCEAVEEYCPGPGK